MVGGLILKQTLKIYNNLKALLFRFNYLEVAPLFLE
jgi:hypothetical protein